MASGRATLDAEASFNGQASGVTPAGDDGSMQVAFARRSRLASVSCRSVHIRVAAEQDWPDVYAFYTVIMAEGRTIAYPPNQTLDEARPWWMESPPGRTVVAVDGDTIIGSAKMGPNRPSRGAHIATASFLVAPGHQGRGTGRALGMYVLDWARAEGFHGIQFNAVVEANHSAVHLWRALGFEIIGTVPEAFDHPEEGLVGLHIMYQRLD